MIVSEVECKMEKVKRLSGPGVAAWGREHQLFVRAILIVLYRLALDVLYWTCLSDHLAYTGFTATFNIAAYSCSVLGMLVFIPAIIKVSAADTPSSIMLTVINYFYFIPLTSYFGCHGKVRFLYLAVALIYWALLLFWQAKIPVLYLKPIPVHRVQGIMIVLAVLCSGFVLYISGRYTGFRLTLDFINVYGIRGEAREYPMSTLSRYVISIIPIALSVILLYWLKRRKYIVCALLAMVFLFLFSIEARKIVFFFLFIVLASYWFYRRWMLRWLPGIMIGCAGAAGLAYKFLKIPQIMTILFQRVMYIPVQLAGQYLEFFQNNPLNMNRDGIMGKLSFSPVYSTTLPRLIGEFRGHPTENANTGLLGDVFANFPIVLGLIILPFVVIMCFRLLDMATYRHEERIVMPFCLYYGASFINGIWSQNLLSTGLLVACLLLFIFPREEEHAL